MYNAFLVFRTVFFALFTYFHVLIFIFASWNVAAAQSSGIPAPGASVFLLVISIIVFMLVPIAYLAELICIKARPAQVRLECGWTVLMSIFHLAASIAVTVNGPPIHCQMHSQWAMCASSSLLVHISWLATLIILTYSLLICVATATHALSVPGIWTTPVPHVPWFRADVETPAPAPRHVSLSSSWSDSSCIVSKYIAHRWDKLSSTRHQSDLSGPIIFTRGRQSVASNRPTWARQQKTRRGVDNPFAMPVPRRGEVPVALAPPPRTCSRAVVTSREPHSVEVGDYSETMSARSHLTMAPRTPSVFPQGMDDPDLPIPCPRRSEWVRADSVMGSKV